MTLLWQKRAGAPSASGDRWVRGAIDRIAAARFGPNNTVRALTGVPEGFRIRVGDWRVLYRIDREADTMDVFRIAPRGGAYR